MSYFGAYEELLDDAVSEIGGGADVKDLYQDARFSVLPEYKIDTFRRRRPTPFEAIVETTRRLRDLAAIEKAISRFSHGGVVGGSMSYGRFYNVKGGSDGAASDIDLLITVTDVSDIDALLNALSEVSGVERHAIDAALKRLDEYRSFSSSRSELAVFSCKVPMWRAENDPVMANIGVSANYHLSLHIAPSNVADQLLFIDAAKIDVDLVGREKPVRDFRETPANRFDHQRSFGGENLRIELESEPFESSHVRETRLFVIDENDHFYPGMFHNLLLPAMDVRWGNSEFRKSVESFRWKLVDRLRHERIAHPNSMLRLSYSHTRSHVFAPHVVRAVDASTQLS